RGRREQQIRRDDECRRLGDGLFRRIATQGLAVGARVHARRSFFHGRVRGFVPESPVADLRVHAGVQGRPRLVARAARRRPADRAQHLRDGDDFVAAIDAGTLPQVAFYKPPGRFTQHPGYTDLMSGDAHVADLLEHLRRSPLWSSTAIIVTYDENGGFWDHVP